MSNQTKLTPGDREMLKHFRENQGEDFNVFHFPERRVTVGVRYIKGHNAARVFVSLASPDETKFRKKVGEFNVRSDFNVWENYGYITGIPHALTGWDNPASIAENVSSIAGYPD